MIKYYSWAIAQKVLSNTPGGNKIYYGLGSLVQKNKKGRSGPMSSAINLVKNIQNLVDKDAVIMDVGTGWYHHEPFLLYLCGFSKFYLFDVVNKSKLNYIKNYLCGIVDNIDMVSNELQFDKHEAINKIHRLLSCNTKEQIYSICNFEIIITKDTGSLFLPENSIDLMVSNCVLNHIPLKILKPELKILRKILKPDGYMHFLIGHDDHWTFHDPKMNKFQYYIYSDKYYRRFFETNFQFQNRLVKKELINLFNDCELTLTKYFEHKNDTSKDEIKKIIHKLDSRFSKYSVDDLSIIHSYVTLQK